MGWMTWVIVFMREALAMDFMRSCTVYSIGQSWKLLDLNGLAKGQGEIAEIDNHTHYSIGVLRLPTLQNSDLIYLVVSLLFAFVPMLFGKKDLKRMRLNTSFWIAFYCDWYFFLLPWGNSCSKSLWSLYAVKIELAKGIVGDHLIWSWDFATST